MYVCGFERASAHAHMYAILRVCVCVVTHALTRACAHARMRAHARMHALIRVYLCVRLRVHTLARVSSALIRQTPEEISFPQKRLRYYRTGFLIADQISLLQNSFLYCKTDFFTP